MLTGKEPLGIQLRLQLFKRRLQVPRTGGHHGIDIELNLPVSGIHGNAPHGKHLHAVFRPETEKPCAALEEDTADRTLRVLQGEIMVPRGVELVVGDLTRYADIAENRLRLNAGFQHGIEP